MNFVETCHRIGLECIELDPGANLVMLFIRLVGCFRYTVSGADILDELHFRPVIGLEGASIYFPEPLRQ